MLLAILLLSLVLLSLTDAGPADAKSSPKQDLEGLENLVEKLELRLRDMETKFQGEKEKLEEMQIRMKHKEEEQAKEKKEIESRLEAKDKEMERRLQELEERIMEEKHEFQRREKIFEASTSKLRMKVDEESFRREVASNISNNNTLTNPSLRDLPIVFISA